MGTTGRFDQAIIMGASMAGLLAARALAEHFKQVTIIERDTLPEAIENRKGVPQGRHAHGLLPGGLNVMNRLFPGFHEELKAAGAVEFDPCNDGAWYQFDCLKLQCPTEDRSLLMSRPLIESIVRRRVLALPNVEIVQGSIRDLITAADKSRVLGVRVERTVGSETYSKELYADLAVDATGCGSHSPQWLEQMGYGRPKESAVKVDLAYASRIYTRKPGQTMLHIVAQAPPDGTRGCALLALEDDRWILTLFGYAGDHPPMDPEGFDAFVRSLPFSRVHELISDAIPLGEIATYKFPANLRRHYEKMKRFPEGYLVLGDAVCSFNPIYGQGMTVASMEADALDNLLGYRSSLAGLAKAFYRKATPIINVPWEMASGGDLSYTHTEGERSGKINLINGYIGKVHRAASVDETVAKAFMKVANFLAPPPSLMKPNIMIRALRASARMAKQPSATRVSTGRKTAV